MYFSHYKKVGCKSLLEFILRNTIISINNYFSNIIYKLLEKESMFLNEI
jgi:hypothetical protein